MPLTILQIDFIQDAISKLEKQGYGELTIVVKDHHVDTYSVAVSAKLPAYDYGECVYAPKYDHQPGP